jgi:hypothetical protein
VRVWGVAIANRSRFIISPASKTHTSGPAQIRTARSFRRFLTAALRVGDSGRRDKHPKSLVYLELRPDLPNQEKINISDKYYRPEA